MFYPTKASNLINKSTSRLQSTNGNPSTQKNPQMFSTEKGNNQNRHVCFGILSERSPNEQKNKLLFHYLVSANQQAHDSPGLGKFKSMQKTTKSAQLISCQPGESYSHKQVFFLMLSQINSIEVVHNPFD